jgi:hypothetical protein
MAIAAYSGGISKADKALRESDSDWNQPNFRLGIDDYPGTQYDSNSTGL